MISRLNSPSLSSSHLSFAGVLFLFVLAGCQQTLNVGGFIIPSWSDWFYPSYPGWIKIAFICLCGLVVIYLFVIVIKLALTLVGVPFTLGSSFAWMFSSSLLRQSIPILHYFFVVLVFPIAEELVFRLVIYWGIFHEGWFFGFPAIPFLTAFLWPNLVFAGAHGLEVVEDPGRLIDVLAIGIGNSVFLIIAQKEFGHPLEQVIVSLIVLHILYNLLISLFKLIPFYGKFFVQVMRALALLVAVVCYWGGIEEIMGRNYW